MALSFAINPDAGETFSDAEQKRKDARMLIAAALGHTPQNVGEGLSAIGQALIARQMNQEASAAEKNNAGINSSLRANIVGGAGAFPAAPGVTATPSPSRAASTPPMDVPSQRVAQAFGDGQQDFINSILPSAMDASKATGVDPRIIVAQAALESGYGRHAPGNNLFGIKGGNGPALATKEVVDGQPINTTAQFRQYVSPTDSVKGYADFINANPRYGTLKSAQGLDAQLDALGASGYATDPAYAAKVGAIARGIQLPQQGAPAATNALASGQPPAPAPALPAPVNVPDMPVASQPIQVAQAANTGTPGTMSDADALKLLGAQPYNPGTNNLQAIVSALGSPAASPMTQRIAAALLEQRMKPNDFGFQTLPDGTVLRTDPRSGTVQPIYQGQGKAPTVQQFFDPETGQPYEAQWNPKTQSWDKVGGVKIPANGLSVTLPDGTVIQQGGKSGADPQSRQTASDVITNAAGKIRDLSKSFGSTGLLGAAESYLPNTNAAEIYRQVGVLKSNASIEALNAMRRESKTGGALGSVTEKEEAMLAAKAGALDPKSPYFQTQLDDYERTLLRIVHGKEAGDKIYEQTRGQENGGTTSNGLKWSIEP